MKDKMKWWREARFGMFIHWGIYAVPAGRWKGKEVKLPHSIGEWIMHSAKIPLSQYSQFAKKFNPIKFNADEWVKLAKDTGMKYLVITSKHHDGFAMYDSKVSSYDIVDVTPYKKDPMKDLAKACKKYGIKLCFYYSQDQDWQDPNGSRNDWDYNEKKKDFPKYLREKVKPQLRELLTQYGPIGLIWFDTPVSITKEQSLDLKRFVHKLQPDCLVSGRVGHGVGDYGSLGDNDIPYGKVKGYWETPATLNDTWGYKVDDNNWKPVKDILYLLIDLASKGVNYVLNVGPTAEGIIPLQSVKCLNEIGKWMKKNSDAIYCTKASPYAYEFEWGRITHKKGELYLIFTKWIKGKFVLRGLRNKVKEVHLLANKKRKIKFMQINDNVNDNHLIEFELPRKSPDKLASVVLVKIEGEVNVKEIPLQQSSGVISIPAYKAKLQKSKNSKIHISDNGLIREWTKKTGDTATWDFEVSEAGKFIVKLFTVGESWMKGWGWRGGLKLKIDINGETLQCVTKADEKYTAPRTLHMPEGITNCGVVTFNKSGKYQLKLKVDEFSKKLPWWRLNVSEIRLVPIK